MRTVRHCAASSLNSVNNWKQTHFLVVLSNPVQLSVVRFDRCTQGACRVAAQLATRRGGGGEAGNRSGVFKSGEDSLKVAMQHTALHTDANRGRLRYKKYLEWWCVHLCAVLCAVCARAPTSSKPGIDTSGMEHY